MFNAILGCVPHRADPVAHEPGVGAAIVHHHEPVGRRRRDDHLPRGPAERADAALRGRRDRRRGELAEVPQRDAADDLARRIFFNLIMGIIGSFQVFTSSFVMTQGGPAYATLFYVLYLYQKAFKYLQMGYACALAWILFAVILALTLIVFKTSRRWVYYEAELKR